MVRRFAPALLALMFIPSAANAAVSITEIMYDPLGADTKHEWVEIYNDGMSADISKWKLFQDGVNHKLVVSSGNAILDTGSYAILADDPVTFRKDFPQYAGTIFNISLSGGLNNTEGESLTLKDQTGKDAFTVAYTPDMGAAGDGNSLQIVSGKWMALMPSPGSAGDVTKKIEPPQKAAETTSASKAEAPLASSAVKAVPQKTVAKASGGAEAQTAAPASARAADAFSTPSITWFLGFAVLVLLGILLAQHFRKNTTHTP